ncbi:MAG TPA: hypothetical protein VM432_12065 [Bdellovibrionales bacterium]|nr:hypothetical protein [Bdellovibrionales bacterium]
MKYFNSKQAYLKGFLVLALAANASWNGGLSTLVSTDFASKDGEMAGNTATAAAPAAEPAKLSTTGAAVQTAGTAGAKPDAALAPQSSAAPVAVAAAPEKAIEVIPEGKAYTLELCENSYRVEMREVQTSSGKKTQVEVSKRFPNEVIALPTRILSGSLEENYSAESKAQLTKYITKEITEKATKEGAKCSTETAKNDKDSKKSEDTDSRDKKECRSGSENDKIECKIDRLSSLKLEDEDEKVRRKASNELSSLLSELKRSISTQLRADVSSCDEESSERSRTSKRCEKAQEDLQNGRDNLENLASAIEDLRELDIDEKQEVTLDRFDRLVPELEKIADATKISSEQREAQSDMVAAQKAVQEAAKRKDPQAMFEAQVALFNAQQAINTAQVERFELESSLKTRIINDFNAHNRLRSVLDIDAMSFGDFRGGYSDIFGALQLRPLNMREANSASYADFAAPDNAALYRASAARTWGNQIAARPPRLAWLNNANSAVGLNNTPRFNSPGASSAFPGGLQGSPRNYTSPMRTN